MSEIQNRPYPNPRDTSVSSLLITGLVAASLMSASCGDAGGDEPSLTSQASAQAPQNGAAHARATGAGQAQEPTTWRLHYDLVAHPERAEVQEGDTWFMDLGGASGQKYTLGGWRTRTGESATFDGVQTSLIRRVTGFYRLPIRSAGDCTLSLRGQAFGDGRVTLYLDNETFGHVRLPTDGSFAVVSATIDSNLCQVGEHELRLRVSRAGRAAGHGRAAMALDWIRLGPAAPTPAEVAANHQLSGPGLPMEATRRWVFALEVPQGAHLRGRVRGAGALKVWLRRPGQDSQLLGSPSVADATHGVFDLSLGDGAGSIAEITLEADGDITLPEAGVFVRPTNETLAELTRRPRNVLVYLTDTLRADRLSVYNEDTVVQTPHLQSWARGAARFTAAHAQENWTKPSVATLLSGLYPWEHQATSEDARVPDSVELLSERLRGRGFRTAAFIANGFVSDRFGFEQGWHSFRNYIREGRRTQARFVAQDAIAWLRERPHQDAPFFLYVHTIDPHVPYLPPPDDLRHYDPSPYQGQVDFHRDRQLLEAVKSGRLPLNARDRRRLQALYDGEVTYHDRHFGALMDAMDELGLSDDTVVVFTSDHGEEFFDHGSVGHGHSVFEELIRVPLLMRIPGLTDGAQSVDAAVGLVDVLPTIFDVIGSSTPNEANIPDDLSGRSLLPLMRGQSEDAPRATVTGFMNGWRTVVVGHYKLIQRTPSRWQVYDLLNDPGEQNDIAPTHPIAVRYLRSILGLHLAAEARGARNHQASRTEIDDALRSQLEALGYVGTSAAPQAE